MLHWFSIKKGSNPIQCGCFNLRAEVPRIHSFLCEPSRQMEDRAHLWIRNGLVEECRECNSLSQENRVSLSLAIFGAEHSSSFFPWTNYATIMKASCLTREGTQWKGRGKATEKEWVNQIKGQDGPFLSESVQFLILWQWFSNVMMKEVLKKPNQMCTSYLNTIVHSEEQER